MRNFTKIFLLIGALSATASTHAQIVVKLDITESSAPCAGHEFEPNKAAVMDLYLYPLDKGNGIMPVLVKNGKHSNVKSGRYLVSRQQLDHPDDLEFYRQWFSGKNDIQDPAIDRRTVNKKVIFVGKDLKEQTFDYHYHQYCGWQIDPKAELPASKGK
jgi:hypothetical protein